jgi:hypothetical protein
VKMFPEFAVARYHHGPWIPFLGLKRQKHRLDGYPKDSKYQH